MITFWLFFWVLIVGWYRTTNGNTPKLIHSKQYCVEEFSTNLQTPKWENLIFHKQLHQIITIRPEWWGMDTLSILGWLFFADWPKNAKFCTCYNISYMHYRTLECINPQGTIIAYKSQNLVLTEHVLSQNHRKMYMQIIVTLRYVDLRSHLHDQKIRLLLWGKLPPVFL